MWFGRSRDHVRAIEKQRPMRLAAVVKVTVRNMSTVVEKVWHSEKPI